MGSNVSKVSNPGPSNTNELESTNMKGLNHLLETEIDFIVNHIGNEWIQLARKLGLCETDVTGIRQGPGSLKEKVYQVIDKWKHNKGDDATKDHMIECLRKVERQDIADGLSATTRQLTQDVLAGFKQRVVELYSHLNVPQPPRINKDISIDSIFIDQEMEVFTLKSPVKPKILTLQSLIQNMKKHKMLRTLVEGDPGFGKTTLASKIAIDWAKGRQYIRSLNFDLVLLIPLRELGNQHLLDFIVDMFNRAIECPTFTIKTIGKYFDQYKVLLLLDGYDELSPESHTKIHPFLEKTILKNTCILVTSRRGFFTIKQGATNTSKSLTFQHENFLYDFWDARVILEGVTKEQRTKLLQEHFEIPTDTLDKANELFEDNADELFQCPLLVFWLGWMLETYGLQDIQTRTSFYKRFINLILHKTLVRENQIQEDDAFDIFSTSTDQLTISVQQQIIEFGELAMQKMYASDVLFNECDLNSLEKSILLKSDLLISYKSLTKQQEQTIYQPMHRSLLEFLVAFNFCYFSKDIHELKEHIRKLMLIDLEPSGHSLLYPFIAGLLEDKAHWLFECLSSHQYSAFKPELMNIFQELKEAENDDLLQHMLSFVPDYCDVSNLHRNNERFSSSLFNRLLEVAAEKQLISVMKWDIAVPFPVAKITLDKLYVTTAAMKKRYFVSDNMSIHSKKLIYSISKRNDKQRCSLKQLVSVCKNITADEIELHLKKLEFKECDLVFEEIQKEMNDIKFHRVNCYFCQLKNKHVNVLTRLVDSGCITKGIAINDNNGKMESYSLSELCESVIKSSIKEFTFRSSDKKLIFKISMPIQLQLLHLEGVRLSINCVNSSIHNLTLLDVANDDENVINVLSRLNHVNYFRCNDWLLARCLFKKVNFLATVTELHLVLTEHFSRCPSFIQLMPSLTTFTLNVYHMRDNLNASVEKCVISALESTTTTTTTTNSSCAKSKQLKLLGIHFIPSLEVFQFFINCFTQVESTYLECLELSFEKELTNDSCFNATLYKFSNLLRNDNTIQQLNFIDLYDQWSESVMSDIVTRWFSEEENEIKKRFYHNDQQLRLHIPLFHYQESCRLFYFELKQRI